MRSATMRQGEFAQVVMRRLRDGEKVEDVCLNLPGLRRVVGLSELEVLPAESLSLSVILCARHNRREGAYYAGQSEETSA